MDTCWTPDRGDKTVVENRTSPCPSSPLRVSKTTVAALPGPFISQAKQCLHPYTSIYQAYRADRRDVEIN